MLHRILTFFGRQQRRRRAEREVAELGDWLLHDLGIRRRDIAQGVDRADNDELRRQIFRP
ncbi:MAG TPA: DUF1127 domain-containing protein [Sinorhizobium sp.]|nr:DUF1127 domain-containing protein [Sinorhizobium sp.]